MNTAEATTPDQPDQVDDRLHRSVTDSVDPSDPSTLAPLTVTDRCDSSGCSAQAYLRVRLDSGLELVFCGHHGHALTPTLAAQGAVIRDDTHLIS